MAITATIALSPSTVKTPVGTTATVTVSNSAAGGPAVPVLGIRPIVYRAGTQQKDSSVAVGDPGVYVGAAVAAGGSAKFFFDVDPHSPQVAGAEGENALPANRQYDITCEIVAGDGTIVIPTVATLTVNPPTLE